MTQYSSHLLRTLDQRGYLHQLTNADGLDALASKQVVPAYIGFDATASSLHVGNLVSIMLLRRVQQAGHKPIVVIGGGTTKVGDPSGKDDVRKMLDEEGISANIASIRRSFEKFLTFGDGPTDAILVNNADWLDALDYIPFLRDVGRHFTINRMLTFDSVKLRLEREQPLTFLEFNYMILQAYDYLELSRQHDCRLQLGGSDQWGNIVNGIELTRRIDGTELYGVTTPLITKADGSKMGKSVDGAIWLNSDSLSDYDYWQFWRNTDDRDVGRFLRLFTDISIEEITELESLEGAEINSAKIALANAATAMCRGEDAAKKAQETAQQAFSGSGSAENLPHLTIPASGIAIIDAIIALGFCASKGEARRLLKGGAVKIEGEKISDEKDLIMPPAEDQRLSVGKKKHAILSA